MECADRSVRILNCSKTPFKETDKLVFDKTYLGKSITSFALKFYSDGRLIFFTSRDGFTIKPSDPFNKNWENAPNIGYWRVEDNKIKVEYFLCGDSGFYKREQGEIKGDIIVFYENFYHPFYKEVREKYYVLSDMSFEQRNFQLRDNYCKIVGLVFLMFQIDVQKRKIWRLTEKLLPLDVV